MQTKQSRLVILSRNFRSYHKYIGLVLAILFVISSLTGVLLGVKKQFDVLQAPTQKGEAKKLEEWLDLSILAEKASEGLAAAYPGEEGLTIDRMDVRPSKGVVKVIFEEHWWEVQVDGKTGEVKSIAKRTSDWIETLHDGSIISEGFKVVSMNLVGWGLFFMTLSGIWLWYGPLLIRKNKRSRQTSPKV